jgi:nitrite reductase (NAD(P)H)
MKYDVKRREYDVIVVGEEPHLAYNRVGLTSFFQHRKVENLYLNPKEWVCSLIEEHCKHVLIPPTSTTACQKVH